MSVQIDDALVRWLVTEQFPPWSELPIRPVTRHSERPPGATLEAAMRTVTAAPTARPATGRAAATAQIEAGEAAIGAGALDAGLQCLRRAIVEADAIGEAALRARARVALGGALVHAARGRDEEGATALHEALAIGKDASSPLAAAACRELGYVEFLRGRNDGALVWLREAAQLAGDDPAEQARIAIVHGSALSDPAHYDAAIALLRNAEALANSVGDPKQIAYALSMLGRAPLLHGQLDAATDALDQSVLLAQQGWTAFLPWPQSLRAEIDLCAAIWARRPRGSSMPLLLGVSLAIPVRRASQLAVSDASL